MPLDPDFFLNKKIEIFPSNNSKVQLINMSRIKIDGKIFKLNLK